ncbi:MAG: PQQ-binding-like beta-propeller repeat protein [Ktedonobacteraceae bacterium]
MNTLVRRIMRQSRDVYRLQKDYRKFRWCLFMLLALVLMGLASCGKDTQNTTANSKLSGIGIGTPQPGTDGKPMVSPTGHWESIVAASGLAYVGSDNDTLYALKTSNGSVQWHYHAGSSVEVAAVVTGVVYVYADSSLYSLNASSGALLWQHSMNRNITDVIVTGSVVYADTNAEQNAPTVYALNITTGAELWHYTANSISPGMLAVGNGNVYYMEAASIGISPDETMLALSTSDGHVLWHMHLGSTDGLASGTVAQANGVVFVATLHGAVYAVRASDGVLLWHVARPTGQDNPPFPVSPTVVNGIVYTAAQQHIYALRASDGKQVWQYGGSYPVGPIVMPFVIVNGVVYASDGNGHIFALRANDGSQLWQHANMSSQTLIVQNGQVHLFLGDSIATLSAGDGSLLWQRSVANVVGGESWVQPEVVANGLVYTEAENGTVQAFRASDGMSLWQYNIAENAVPLMSPIYSAGITFTASTAYTQALRLIADFGLQTYTPCLDGWKPEGGASNFQYHNLLVSSTPISAINWYNRLQASSMVMSLNANPMFNCPMMTGNDVPPFLTAKQAGTYVRVTFSQTTTYDSALDAVNTLGFRLANPTYERERAQGPQPTWSSMGQESSYSKTHTLLLATTQLNAAMWANQLKATTGVVQVSDVLAALVRSADNAQ